MDWSGGDAGPAARTVQPMSRAWAMWLLNWV